MKKKPAPTTRSPKRKTPQPARPVVKKTARRGSQAAMVAPWLDDKLFRKLIENSSETFALSDPRGNILYLSPSAERISGVPDAKILSTSMFDWIFPEDLKSARQFFAEMLKNPEKKIPFQIRLKSINSNPCWIDGTGVNWLAKPGFQALVLHYRDVTEPKEAAAALLESENRYRNLFENARLAIFQSTPEGKVLRVNNEFARMFGYLSPEDVFKSVKDVATDLYADPSRRGEILRLRKKDPALSLFENLYRRKDGSTFWGRLYMQSATDSQGAALYFEGFIEDITKNRAMEESLQESEERYRGLFQNSLEGIGLSRGNQIIDANKALLEIFGYEQLTEFVSIPLMDHVAPSSRDFVRTQQEKARKGEPYTKKFTYQILCKNGTVRDVEISLEQVKIGNEFFTQSTFRDVTERDRAEEALRESEERYRQLVEQTVEGILVLNPEGKFIFVNTALCKMLGYTREEMLRMNVLDTYPEELREEGRERTDRIRAGKSQHFERPMKRKDGTQIMIEGTAIRLANGNMQGIMHDVTGRKQAEEALRDGEERYRLLFELSPDSIAVYQEGKVLYANPATLSLLGMDTADEIIGKPMLEFVHPDYREMVIKRSQQQEQNGRPATPVEEKFIRRDGGAVDVEVMAAPLQYRGKLSHMVISRDISDRKRADEVLREKEERFRATFENATVGVCIVGLDGRLLQVNQQMSKMFGYTREELERMTVGTIAHPDDAELSPAFMQQAMSGEFSDAGFDKRYVHKDGRIIWGHVSSSLVRDSQGNPLYFISHVQDITDRKEAEQALRESEEKFARLFQDAPVLIIITDSASGECLDVNEEALHVFGYQRNEIIGHALIEIGAMTPEDRARILATTKTSNRDAGVEITLRAKDGHTVVGLFRGERISIAGRDCMLGAMVDITERKQAEEALRALATRHAALLSAIPEIVMEVDKDKVYTWANRAGEEFFGEDVIGKDAASYFEGEQNTYTEVQPLFEGSQDTIYVESWQRRKDGEKRLLAWWCRTLKDDRGNITGALSSARDITERRRTEEQIRNLSRFPEENPNPVMRMTPDGVLIYANPASRPFIAYWNIGIGQPVPEECRTPIRDVFAAQQAKVVETRLGERIFRCTITPIVDGGYVNVYARDITDRLRAEEEVTHQTEELRQRNLELGRVNVLTERRMQQLAAMRTVDMAISSSFKSELVMEILLEQLTSQLKVHAADILIFHPAMQGFRFFCGRGFYAAPSTADYLRLADSYAGRAAQERRMIKVPRLDEKADQAKIFPKIAKEGFVSYACLPLIAKGQIKGVMEVCQRESLDLGPEEDSFLEMLAGQAAIAIDNAEMFGNLQSSRDELQLAFNSTLAGWARALEMRDRESEGETQRSADLAMRLAQMLGENDDDLTQLYRGAILHDVGMISIPEGILLKRGPLTNEEWTIVRKHPQVAFDLLSPVLFLRTALDIPHCHHERWDGSGYPRGLKGDHIPLAARIFAVVDVWNALRSDRPYRKAWTDADAGDYLRKQAGKQFDPAVIQSFFRLIGGQ